MNNLVWRIFVEKKKGFDVEASEMHADFVENLHLSSLEGVRIINRYDVSHIEKDSFEKAKTLIFSEAPVDNIYDETLGFPEDCRVFGIEFLPGQFDQRADSAEECISILTESERPKVRFAKIIVLAGTISDEEFDKIKKYAINPVESQEASLNKPSTLDTQMITPDDVAIVDGFMSKDTEDMTCFMNQMGFAMDIDDLKFCQEYFKNTEKRDPYVTELRMIDTYWSDHCRHTTFLTSINSIEIGEGKYSQAIRASLADYTNAKDDINGKERAVSLMNIATMAAKKLKRAGLLTNLDESEEINACSINVDVMIDGKPEKYLIMFKNETHNHPTEIEPFGGAATCLGGAIRDPLSGRAYVYQAMRVTGSGDPRVSIEETVPGKLMQRKISRGAAAGYSSYGNQIGLATGLVHEIYDEGYVAKRMEIGAVVGAAKSANVVREVPEDGDIIILLGGKTGRDGCGGATGSSKAHDENSIEECGAEVQKGNPPVERKIQRLFRNGALTTKIKRCNDFGAGGVSVAIGELADGLLIDLDKLPKKYEGLDGTELAISESQERMAVVVRKSDVDEFIRLANEENLLATVVATVNNSNRLSMIWRGKTVCDISRDFLNTNGVTKNADAKIVLPKDENSFFNIKSVDDLQKAWLEMLSNINIASQKGLVERFDASIGAGSVFMPFGGKYQLTPTDAMVAKIPVLEGITSTATAMSYGYNSILSTWSPYHGAMYAVIESIAKLVACGVDYTKIYLTFQEYFERLGSDPTRWGKPLAALLGAYEAQVKMKLAAIGGKDSMSGSFNDIDVPPTLVSFAISPIEAKDALSNEFKGTENDVVLVFANKNEENIFDFDHLHKQYSQVHKLAQNGSILSAMAVGASGLAEIISKMCFGNKIGFCFNGNVAKDELFNSNFGSLVLEVTKGADLSDVDCKKIGKTCTDNSIVFENVSLDIDVLIDTWSKPLERVFPTKAKENHGNIEAKNFNFDARNIILCNQKVAKPRVFIPVFPGTNCEYDTAKQFTLSGAEADVFVIKNVNQGDIAASLKEMAARIDKAQMIAIAGGFSGGDEPDGSAKFLATAFRNPAVSEATMNMLKKRDGLMLGICNGFQALIKLGLITHGEIVNIEEDFPTLTFNTIGRHISTIATTKIVSNKSPWLAQSKLGDEHAVAFSHGEGRFVASKKWIEKLAQNGQIATQYVDLSSNATYDIRFNPNGSTHAIEGATSPDGKVLGKMGHSERIGEDVCKNIVGNKEQGIFLAGVKYFL